MKAKEFCEKLSKLKPPYILLMELGFSENLANEFINHYDCFRKVDSTPILRNPIKEIIENYSYSTVEIGEFHFLRFTQTSEKYFRFGCGDGVDMAIRNVDGAIVTLDDDLEIGEIAQFQFTRIQQHLSNNHE